MRKVLLVERKYWLLHLKELMQPHCAKIQCQFNIKIQTRQLRHKYVHLSYSKLKKGHERYVHEHCKGPH